MINTFTAIDFETAQGYRWSICQVGLIRVENGEVVKQLNLLVQPPQNYYWDRFIEIHGITPEDTKNAPTFDVVWPQIEPYITGQHVVAHNGFSFDFLCIEQTLEYYNLCVPEYDKHCTYRIYGSDLASLCEEYCIELNHHDALSDALACAKLFLQHNSSNEKTTSGKVSKLLGILKKNGERG